MYQFVKIIVLLEKLIETTGQHSVLQINLEINIKPLSFKLKNIIPYPWVVRLEILSIKTVVQIVKGRPVVIVRMSLGGYGGYVGHILEFNLEPRAPSVLWYPDFTVVQTSLVCRTARLGATGS